MTFQIRKRAQRPIVSQPRFTFVGDEKIIGSAHWLGADGRRQERYQVLTLRDGEIVDIQDCATRRQAERFVGRHG